MPGGDPIMDERQQRIFDALTEKHADLASVYRSALFLLSEVPVKGDERTRISYICHSMREVMNRVPQAMGSPRLDQIEPSTTDQVEGLPDLFSQYPEMALDADGESVPVPHDVAVVFDALIKTAIREKARSRGDVASLLTDDGNSAHAGVRKWIVSRRFFVKWAHFHDKVYELHELPSDALIRTHVYVFDQLFDGVITAFFTNLHSIEGMLAEINAHGEESDDE